MLLVTNQCRAPKALLFSTNQTKVQFLYYGHMTRKVNVSGILFPSYPKQKGKRITWSHVNLGTVNLCLSGGGGRDGSNYIGGVNIYTK